MESGELSAATIAATVTTAVVKDVYRDTLQPAAKKTGEILKLVPDTVGMLLAPLSGLVWSYQTITDTIKPLIAEKIKNIAENKLKTPEPYIAVPAIEALRYTLGQDELRNLFINLLVASMNTDTVDQAHPAFVEMIKQMAPLDANMLREALTSPTFPIIKIRRVKQEECNSPLQFDSALFAPGQDLLHHIVNISNEKNYQHVSSSLDNLKRLNLIDIKYGQTYENETLYDKLENHEALLSLKSKYQKDNYLVVPVRGMICLTTLGHNFARSCIDLPKPTEIHQTEISSSSDQP